MAKYPTILPVGAKSHDGAGEFDAADFEPPGAGEDLAIAPHDSDVSPGFAETRLADATARDLRPHHHGRDRPDLDPVKEIDARISGMCISEPAHSGSGSKLDMRTLGKTPREIGLSQRQVVVALAHGVNAAAQAKAPASINLKNAAAARLRRAALHEA